MIIKRSKFDILFSFVFLFSFVYYLFLNISQPDKGSVALITLVFTFAIGIMFLSYRMIFSKKILIKHSGLIIGVWFTYFLLKIIYDLGVNHIHDQMTSTSGGILLFYLLGVIFATILDTILKYRYRKRNSLLTYLYILLYILIGIFIITISVKFSEISVVSYSGTLNYIPEYEGLYQRPADFLAISFVILSLLLIMTLEDKKKSFVFFNILIYVFLIILGIYSLQLLNSNKIVPLLLVQLLLMVILFNKNIFNNIGTLLTKKRHIKIRILLLNKTIVKKTLKYFIVSIVLIAMFLILSSLADYDLLKFRVFSIMDSDQGGSLINRFKTYKFFYEQFNYSPIFGTLEIKDIIGGKNTHSFVLELLVNTGLIGFLLLFTYMGSIVIEQINKKYEHKDILLLKKDFFSFIYLWVVFILACFSVGINWPPIWFMFGLVSPPFKLK
jgi:hypothetical protein